MDWNCYYCGAIVTGRARCKDHFKPRSKGGLNNETNLVPACNVCNGIKGDRTFEQARSRLVLNMIGWPKFDLVHIEWLRSKGFDLSEYDNAKLWFERNNTAHWHKAKLFAQLKERRKEGHFPRIEILGA